MAAAGKLEFLLRGGFADPVLDLRHVEVVELLLAGVVRERKDGDIEVCGEAVIRVGIIGNQLDDRARIPELVDRICERRVLLAEPISAFLVEELIDASDLPVVRDRD